MGVLIKGPGMDGRVDGEAQVDGQHRNNEEVEERVVAGVVLIGLWLSHRSDDSAGMLRASWLRG